MGSGKASVTTIVLGSSVWGLPSIRPITFEREGVTGLLALRLNISSLNGEWVGGLACKV